MKLISSSNILLIFSLWGLTACGTDTLNEQEENRVIVKTVVGGVSSNVLDASSDNYKVFNHIKDKNFQLKLGDEKKDVYVLLSNPTSTVHSATITHSNKMLKPMNFSKKELEREPNKGQHAPSKVEDFNNQLFNFKDTKKENLSHKKIEKSVLDREGEHKIFYMNAETTSNSVAATAKKVITNIQTEFGEKSLTIWVEDDAYGGGCSKAKCINDTMVNALADKFLKEGSDNDIYDWVTNVFGEEWGVSNASSLIDPTDNISILLTDINNDNEKNGGVVGYFYSKDNFKKSSYSGSNERIMFYIDSVMYANGSSNWNVNDFWPQQIFTTLAHEFQHMIYFYHKNVKQNLQGTDTWINEMLSVSTEDLLAVKMEASGPRNVESSRGDAGAKNNYNGRYSLFNKNNRLSPLSWDNTLENYSTVSSFGAYLMRNYGGAEFLHNIVDNKLINEEALMYAVHQNANGEDKTFDDLIHEWGVAVLLSKRDDIPQDSGFLYNAGDFIDSEYDRINYSLGSINFFNYNPLPTIESKMGKVAPKSNFYYKVGENLKGNVNLDISDTTGLNVSVVVVK